MVHKAHGSSSYEAELWGGNCWPGASDHSAYLCQTGCQTSYHQRKNQHLPREITKHKIPPPNKLLIQIMKNVNGYSAQ
jgi:hypothetical protein